NRGPGAERGGAAAVAAAGAVPPRSAPAGAVRAERRGVMDAPRVVVIGAGAAGTATAAAAARLGARVTVIDRRGIAAGSSGLSAGVFTTTYADPLEVELRAVCVREIGRLARDTDLHVVRNGFLRLARTERELELFSRAIEV